MILNVYCNPYHLSFRGEGKQELFFSLSPFQMCRGEHTLMDWSGSSIHHKVCVCVCEGRQQGPIPSQRPWIAVNHPYKGKCMCKHVLMLLCVSRFRYCVIVLWHINTLYLHSVCMNVYACVCVCVCRGKILAAAILDGFLGSYNQRTQTGEGFGKLQEWVLEREKIHLGNFTFYILFGLYVMRSGKTRRMSRWYVFSKV